MSQWFHSAALTGVYLCFVCEYFVVVMSPFAWIEIVDTSTLLLFLVVFLCGLWLLSPPGSPVHWPPGPKSWPLIGTADVFWNNDQIHLTFTELAKKYGEIVHLRFGPRGNMVVLTGQEVIRSKFKQMLRVFYLDIYKSQVI